MTARWFTLDAQFSGDGATLPYDIALLDALIAAGYTPYQAYSLRRLTSTYTGNAITVRRSSDSTTANIGFVDYQLDTAALLAFAGAGDAFVTTWHNQAASGSARNMTQTTTDRQPKIVSSGALVTMGTANAPAIDFSVNLALGHLVHTQPGMVSLIGSSGVSVAQVQTDTKRATGANSVSYGENNNASGTFDAFNFSWTETTATLRARATSDANVTQNGFPQFAGIPNDNGVHSDIFTKSTGASSSLYRDGIAKATAAWNPTLPTGLTRAGLGAQVFSSGVNSRYLGKIGEHIMLAGVVGASAVSLIASSHSEYFGL